jgi:hypothetical protein
MDAITGIDAAMDTVAHMDAHMDAGFTVAHTR